MKYILALIIMFSSNLVLADSCLNKKKDMSIEQVTKTRKNSEAFIRSNPRTIGSKIYVKHLSCIKETYAYETELAYKNKDYPVAIVASSQLLNLDSSHAKAFYYYVMSGYESKNNKILKDAVKLTPGIVERDINDRYFKLIAVNTLMSLERD